MGNITAIVDLCLGDSGKGRVADFYAGKNKVDFMLRVQGGGNAGHTIQIKDEIFKLHHIPCGVLRPGIKNLLCAGMVINPKIFCEEIEGLETRGIDTSNVFIDGSAHVNLPFLYSCIDEMQEDKKSVSIGTTKKGIGPAYSNKYSRHGIRFWDLRDTSELKSNIHELYNQNNIAYRTLEEQDYEAISCAYEKIKDRIIDGRRMIRSNIHADMLIEGAQGCWLDVDYGNYPFVTSSYTTSAGACLGTGLSIGDIDDVVGVFKAYSTYVGNGTYIAEADKESGDYIRGKGTEYGTTTGRPRRCGWIDIPMLMDATLINNANSFVITKVDVLSGLDIVKMVVGYRLPGGDVINHVPSDPYLLEKCEPVYEEYDGWDEFDADDIDSFWDFPQNLVNYIKRIGDFVDLEIFENSYVSYGPEREQIIYKEKSWLRRVV